VDGNSTSIPNKNNSFDCFNELIKDFEYTRVARLHPNSESGNVDCILKKTDTINSNKQQDAQYAIISGD